jgi:cell wall-associated NlpC family hydrolase
LISTTRKIAVALIALTLATVATAGAASSHSRQAAYAEARPSLSLLASQLDQPFDNQVAPPAVAAPPTSYVVARGDTLGAISARFCGTRSHYPNLAAASGIGNFDLIYPGQRITLDCSHAVRTLSTTRNKPANAVPTPQHAVAVVAQAPVGKAASVVAFALAQVGRPYIWGAAGPRAFDCSGLVVAAFSRIGISLPHQSEQLLARGTSVSRANLRPGDVIWPEHGHVMIYIGNGRVVEAADPQQGVRTNTVYRFMTARRYV